MPDTLRTRAQLITALADNTGGAIGAQTLRDFLVSIWVHGSLSRNTSGNFSAGSAIKYTGFDTAGPLAGVTADTALDRLTVGVSGVFHVSFSLSFAPSLATGGPFTFEIRKNGGASAEPGLRATANPKTTGLGVNVAASHLLALTAGDYVELWLYATSSIQLLTISGASLVLHRVG